MKKGILAVMLLGMTFLAPIAASNATVITGPNAQNDITSERIAVMDDLVLSVLKQSASRVGAAVMEKYVTPKLIKMINGPDSNGTDANNGTSSTDTNATNYAYDVNNNGDSSTTNYTYDTSSSNSDSANNSSGNYTYDLSGDHQH